MQQMLTKTGGEEAQQGVCKHPLPADLNPKTRALAAACFHRVTKANQSVWNFSMLPRGRARNHAHGDGKGRKEERTGRGNNRSRTGGRRETGTREFQ